MASPFLGQIQIFGFNFAPRGWAFCNGQLLSISQNTALFSLLGTTYGGNGQTTFALPNLQGRVPMHVGQGPGLTNRTQGEVAGTETHTLNANEMPVHTHTARASSGDASDTTPVGNVLAGGGAYAAAPNQAMNALAITTAGGSQPHNNLQPYLVLNFCIALQGIFPSRN
jgi:microcystin-dependent protein